MNMVSNELEVDLEGAKRLVENGSKVMLFESDYSEVQMLSETFGIKEEDVEIIDVNDFRIIHMHYGEEEDIKKVAKKFERAVVVCQHGNTSLALATALAENGIKAYSLKGGLAGILSR